MSEVWSVIVCQCLRRDAGILCTTDGRTAVNIFTENRTRTKCGVETVKSVNETATLTFWHRSFTFNSNKSPIWCNNFSGYYPDVCLQLNMFWAPGPTTNAARLSPQYKGKTRGCHCSHWAPDDGRETPKIFWAVNERQDNKLKNCCIRLVIYLNCTMIHGLTNLKLYI